MKFTALDRLPPEAVSHNAAIQKKVMLRSGELPHLVYFSQARFAPGQIAGAHHHPDMCEVFFVEAGTGIFRINGSDRPLAPGICIAVEPNEVHEVMNTGTEELVLTYFGIQV